MPSAAYRFDQDALELDFDLPPPKAEADALEESLPPAPAAAPASQNDNAAPSAPEDTLDEDNDAQQEEEDLPAARGKGRPRSQSARKAILKATNSLLLHMSVQELSIEAIAKKAKVGKTTIYRWWPNKTAIVMDALMSQPDIYSPMATPRNNAEAITMQLEKLIGLLHSKNGETISQLFSEAQGDSAAHDIFSKIFLVPLLDAIEFSVEEGKKAGEFRADLDTKLAVDMLCGPIFFRLMAAKPGRLRPRA
jgi:AcrR family transcriptional regulator